jgi:hypothetical protein
MTHYKRPTYKRPNNFNNHYEQPEEFFNFCSKKSVSMDKKLKDFVFYQLTEQYYFDHKPIQKLNNINNISSKYLITINKKNKYSFLLFLTRFNNKNYSIFIYNFNGSLQFYSVKFSFHNELYNGTLMKGELIKNQKDCWIYYISDLIYYKNDYRYEYNLSHKLDILSKLLKSEYVFDDFMNVCHLQIKSYFLFNHLRFIKEDCEIIFIPEYNNQNIYSYNVILSKKQQISEIKNNESKEFIIKKTNTPDVYELYDINTKKFNSIACISKLKTSLYLKEKFKDNNQFITKTKYSEYFKSFIPII